MRTGHRPDELSQQRAGTQVFPTSLRNVGDIQSCFQLHFQQPSEKTNTTICQHRLPQNETAVSVRAGQEMGAD
ncbi:hypothetical protein BaRGS_00001801 [Batillaria attramentaria]|uniref:Uncharacterized protein n=1 Tax=Batillaria attramentaria TaxID=370345 RepID=A0ABD0M5G3_9CAEN